MKAMRITLTTQIEQREMSDEEWTRLTAFAKDDIQDAWELVKHSASCRRSVDEYEIEVTTKIDQPRDNPDRRKRLARIISQNKLKRRLLDS